MNIEEAVIKLTETQTGQETRIGSLEAAFKQVAQALKLAIEMTAHHEERLDAHDEAIKQLDGKLDALKTSISNYGFTQFHNCRVSGFHHSAVLSF